jgi:hypothetical protein
MMGRVVEASPDKPFLGLILEFDLAVMAEVWQSLNRTAADAGASVQVVDEDGPLADCALRMMRLLEKPEAIPALSSRPSTPCATNWPRASASRISPRPRP